MPPQQMSHESDGVYVHDKITDTPSKTEDIEVKIIWRNVIAFSLLHLAFVYGSYLFFYKAMWLTCIFEISIAHGAGLGITAGAHRLWTHRSYKARLPLRILLLYLNTMAMQNSLIIWVKDHRLHHKYSETNADPHNAKRGFFFSHIGWLLVERHPEVKAKIKTIDISDLKEDPLLRFQHKYYVTLALIACIIIPTYIPTLWGETVSNAFFVCFITRYVYCLNVTWLVNSAAHLWGEIRPYEKRIQAVETKTVAMLTLGEGFHNYHHTFPWDYKTAELGNYSYVNYTTMFINAMAMIGWAYDLKTTTHDDVCQRAQRTGDGSREVQY